MAYVLVLRSTWGFAVETFLLNGCGSDTREFQLTSEKDFRFPLGFQKLNRVLQ